MAAIEAVVGVDVDDRINDLRQQEREYVNMIGRMTPQQENTGKEGKKDQLSFKEFQHF